MLRRIAVLVFVWPVLAWAQWTPGRILFSATLARDLDYPAAPAAAFDAPKMALYKPEGAGPFPALVLLHQCGGLATPRWQNLSMLEWARQAVAAGYVALLVDSFAQRGVDTVCYGPKAGVNFARGARDALLGAAHLKKFAFVDGGRIALAGYSWGAMVGLFTASRLWGGNVAGDERFAAVVSFYPGCFTLRPPNGEPYEAVNPDIDRPLLALLGAEDTETPAAECVQKLDRARTAGAPVEWHVYAAAAHCWDCKNLDGFSKVDVRGNRVTYRYSAEVTADSARRLFAFLEKTMPARR